MRRLTMALLVASVLGLAMLAPAAAQGSFWTMVNGTLRASVAKIQLAPFVMFGGTTSSFPAWKRNSTALEARLADDSARAGVFADTAGLTQATITVGSGTGITVNVSGQVQRQVYKVTVDSTAFVAAATTADVTIATLPAKTALLGIYADLTQTFACAATCTTATLSMTVGSAAGGAQYLASFDADAAAAQFGDADAELGTAMVRAAAIQGGAISWAGNIVSLRLTSGTGNIGNGSATNLSQGSITFYLVTERLP